MSTIKVWDSEKKHTFTPSTDIWEFYPNGFVKLVWLVILKYPLQIRVEDAGQLFSWISSVTYLHKPQFLNITQWKLRSATGLWKPSHLFQQQEDGKS